jgi:hypothetical protein
MPRYILSLLLGFGLFMVGCGKQQPPVVNVVVQSDGKTEAKVSDGNTQAKADSPQTLPPANIPSTVTPFSLTAEEAEQQYELALSDAFRFLAEGNDAQAKVALEKARSFKKSEFVESELTRLNEKGLLQESATKTVDNIRTVLKSGAADEATQLVNQALAQYEDPTTTQQLSDLKRQADALRSIQLQKQQSQVQFRQEAEQAAKSGNLRAALLSYEQAITTGVEDAGFRQSYDTLRTKLSTYDTSRTRAAELRKDPRQLEQAVQLFRTAREAWDTPEVRQDIQSCELALSHRRDRLAVTDFEVSAEVGQPGLGRSIAEDLLPQFKSRFDLVERSQLQKVVGELSLPTSGWQAVDNSRSEVAKLLKARFLVVGSVSKLNGLQVHARLVDVESGLIIQTAKLVAATSDELQQKLPGLGKILLMNDAEKIAYEQQLAKSYVVTPPTVFANLPPAPEVMIDQSPAAIIIDSPRPPVFGDFSVNAFQAIPLQPAAAPVVITQAPVPLRDRALSISIELGDNAFRRGLYREAARHFEFALSIAPEQRDIQFRIDRCRPHLPSTPVIIVRERVAVLPFAEVNLAPPVGMSGLGIWVSEQLPMYLHARFDVIDHGELFWWMGRMNVRVADVLTDPTARALLARAMNVRYFALGTLEGNAGIVASSHLIDAQYNVLVAKATIRVNSVNELKCRLPELARIIGMPTAEREVFVQQEPRYQALVVELRHQIGRKQFTLAIEVGNRARSLRPESEEVRLLMLDAQRGQQFQAVEQARVASFQRDQVRLKSELDRQRALAAAAEQARRDAEIRLQQEKQNTAVITQKVAAHTSLIEQGRQAMRNNEPGRALQLFQAAVAISGTPGNLQTEIDQAQQKLQQQMQVEANQIAARNAAKVAEARQAEIDAARVKLEAQQRQREQELLVRQQAEKQRKESDYVRLLDTAKQAQAKGNLDQQIAALQSAKEIKPGSEVDNLLNAALIEQARQVAAKKGESARKDLEAQLVMERDRAQKAEAEAAKNKQLYEQAVAEARQAMSQKDYDQAVVKYRKASLHVRTDEAVQGMKQAQELQLQAKTVAMAPKTEPKLEPIVQPKVEPKLVMVPPKLTPINPPVTTPKVEPKMEPKVVIPPTVPMTTPKTEPKLVVPPTLPKVEPKMEPKTEPKLVVPPKLTPVTPPVTTPKVEPKMEPKVVIPPTVPMTTPKTEPKLVVPPTLPKVEPKMEPKLVTPPKLTPVTPPVTTPKVEPKMEPKVVVPPKLTPTTPPVTLPKVEPKVTTPPVPKVDPTIATRKAQAAGLEAAKKYAEALNIYRDLVKQDPMLTKKFQFVEAMASGQKDLNTGKFGEAILSFDRAVQLDPTSRDAKDFLNRARAKTK